jgi:manganese transport protein
MNLFSPCGTLALIAIVFLSRFQWIERTFGLSGLLMIVFGVSAVFLHPDWSEVLHGLIPRSAPGDSNRGLLYAYFAVGIFSAMLMEYEVHFYSSGAIEEDWKPDDLGENLMVASLGSVLGSLLTAGLLILGAMIYLPRQIFPEMLSTAIFAGAYPFAKKALVVALFGSLACIVGAAIETALSGAYNLCQFYNWPWGKNLPARSAPIYSMTWIGSFVMAAALILLGIKPLQLVNFSIIFGMAVMPFTYYPILRTAGDRNIMGKHVNTKLDTALGIVFLIVITVAALAAFPLMILTHGGRP